MARSKRKSLVLSKSPPGDRANPNAHKHKKSRTSVDVPEDVLVTPNRRREPTKSTNPSNTSSNKASSSKTVAKALTYSDNTQKGIFKIVKK